jgi:nucleoside-diphosphate-sugar epimerase
MNMPKVLVTGASGFVGYHLLARLVGSGRQVVALHNRPLSAELRDCFGSKVIWRQADIVDDDLSKILKDVGTVFHLAAYASNSEASQEVALMERVNVLGTERLAAASKVAGVRHFIFVSSVAAGDASTAGAIDDGSDLPLNSYGKTKKQAEEMSIALSSDEFGVTVLRPSALFGEYHTGSIYELVKVISEGRFFIIGNGLNRMNFYYVGDFVDLLLVVENNVKVFGQVFMACDDPHSLGGLVYEIEELLGLTHKRLRIPLFFGYTAGYGCDFISTLTGHSLPLSSRRVRAMTCDVAYSAEKLERIVRLRTKVGLKEGLSRSISWYYQKGLL